MGILMGDTSYDYVHFLDKLCARRILCFLKRRYLEGAAHKLEQETAVFFDLSHLQFLATTARWNDLVSYVHPFLRSPMSLQAIVLLQNIHIYRLLGTISAGQKDVIDTLYPLFDDDAAKKNPYAASLNAFLHDVQKHPPRDIETWMQVWQTAAVRLKDLALKCPELKGKLHLSVPKYALKRWHVNLSGVLPVPRAYKKRSSKPKACDISVFFEQKRQEIKKRLLAPGVDTTAVAEMLRGNGKLGDEAGVGRKRKMTATLETDAETCTRMKIWEGSCSHL